MVQCSDTILIGFVNIRTGAEKGFDRRALFCRDGIAVATNVGEFVQG